MIRGEPLISLYVQAAQHSLRFAVVWVCLALMGIPSICFSTWDRYGNAEPWAAAAYIAIMCTFLAGVAVRMSIIPLRNERRAIRRLPMLPEYGGRTRVSCQGNAVQVMHWLENLNPNCETTVFPVSSRPVLILILVFAVILLPRLIWERVLGMHRTLTIEMGIMLGFLPALFVFTQPSVSYRVEPGRLITQRHGLFSREYRTIRELALAGAHIECLLGQKLLVIRWPSEDGRRESINLARLAQPVEFSAAVAWATLRKELLTEELRFPWSDDAPGAGGC